MPCMPEWSMPCIPEWSMPCIPEWSMPAMPGIGAAAWLAFAGPLRLAAGAGAAMLAGRGEQAAGKIASAPTNNGIVSFVNIMTVSLHNPIGMTLGRAPGSRRKGWDAAVPETLRHRRACAKPHGAGVIRHAVQCVSAWARQCRRPHQAYASSPASRPPTTECAWNPIAGHRDLDPTRRRRPFRTSRRAGCGAASRRSSLRCRTWRRAG